MLGSTQLPVAQAAVEQRTSVKNSKKTQKMAVCPVSVALFAINIGVIIDDFSRAVRGFGAANSVLMNCKVGFSKQPVFHIMKNTSTY